MSAELAAGTWQPATAGLLNLALALAFGVLLLRSPHAVRSGLTRRVLPGFAAGLAVLAWMAYVLASTEAMTGGDWESTDAMLGDVWRVLTRSYFGRMQWVAGLGALLLCAGAWAWYDARRRLLASPPIADDPRDRHHRREHRQERHARMVYAAGAVVLALARAGTGHAADAAMPWLAIGIHSLHVAAAASWTGALLVAGCVIPGWRHWPVGARAAYGERLSSIATLAMFVALVTGGFNAWRTLGETPSLWFATPNAPYVSWLGTKLLLVACAAMLGAWNRWRLLPRLALDAGEKPLDTSAFARVVGVEALVLVMVMSLAAKLGTTLPPGV
ncbi:CopD family protein [Pandoraea nosoerga]|uniref:Copper resistance D domain-containing protein n=1 Tax=Pandoraea nosoerga TaxID=2508296 RepID=A0A5E4RXV4_9BURK|nr:MULTISPECIES: CopD family protein [Pandoraea]MBN4667716.1 CopD family protein [Pandoraea nosoerga]MBN4677985.1 CopD family protein [Pandoraea nosoerga]MBN4679510.1 CopD family protein [Pandoraea nosoerga]MBN4743401.1 CopD family protein [Pandoraea nosoerga]VVD68350.1 copper resistance D domain-containing protein [Pandoraea nosoerga]